MARFKALVLLALCLGLAGCGRAEEPAPPPTPVATVTVTEAPRTQLRFEGELIPVDELCAVFGYELELLGENSALLEGRSLEYMPEDGVICFDGRYLYAPDGWETVDESLRLEAGAAAKILGLGYEASEGGIIVDITKSRLLSGGEDYYDINFDMDMLYWLPQIIHAEALGQPMAGLIGVGNVVMNRMESEKFPDSITNVIFDREHVIQFEPVENGSIKARPDERAYIAACLCLEGFNTVGDSLFFVNPAYGSYWFDTELELTYVIGEHNFYKYKEP